MDKNRFLCSICDKSFSIKKNLYQHTRNIHKVEPDIPGNVLCPLENCDSSVTTFEKLRSHIELCHSIQIEREDLTFPDVTAYCAWKENLEENENVSFFSENTKILQNGNKKTYLRCHRSGFYSSSATHRIPKSKTCKIGRHCPATIEITETDACVTVIHYKTHVGHDLDLGYQKIGKTDKEIIKRKLADGVPFERILDDIRNNVAAGYSRQHSISRQDLHNIGHSYNLLKPERYHDDDTLSVHIFVSKMRELGDASPVAFFKAQGVESVDLDVDDFMMVLFSPSQKCMFEKFANDKICVDTTHGTNKYNFHLTSIMVVDEFGRGYPSAFCISNRITEKHMAIFFQSLKDKLSNDIKSSAFMSDDYPAYYNAWMKIIGEAEMQLLCAWHVHKNWRTALGKIKNLEKRKFVYKDLCCLLEETNESKFLSILAKFESDLDSDEELNNFANYFRSHYKTRCKMWAYCYRQFAGINTNMYLEALHKVLKHVYMQGKVNKRLDTLIHLLLKLVRDKTFERFTRLIKGSSTGKNAEINSGHRKSTDIKKEDISKISDVEWEVKSQSFCKLKYTVRKIASCKDCFLMCMLCNACLHEFSCTCIEGSVKGNMCKHIHAVVTHEHPITNSRKRKAENCILEEINDNIPVMPEPLKDHQIQIIKNKLTLGLNLTETSKLTSENFLEVNKHIDKALSILQSANNSNNDSQKNNEPANKNLPMQRFHSTKKRRKVSKNILKKPTIAFKQALVESIENDSDMLNISYGDDHSYSKQPK